MSLEQYFEDEIGYSAYEKGLLFKCMYFAPMVSSGMLALLLLFILIQVPYTHDMYMEPLTTTCLYSVCSVYNTRNASCSV